MTTEGDAFILAFHDPLDAVGWALHVQLALLEAPWPADLFQHLLAKLIHGSDGKLLFRGLRVRIAIHTGIPDEIIVSFVTRPQLVSTVHYQPGGNVKLLVKLFRHPLVVASVHYQPGRMLNYLLHDYTGSQM